MACKHWTEFIDETRLTKEKRLALAACRLDAYKWDPILGPKPVGFDDLPDYTKFNCFTGKRKQCKSDIVRCVRSNIISIIGEAEISRFWWIYGQKKSEALWLQWYATKDLPLGRIL